MNWLKTTTKPPVAVKNCIVKADTGIQSANGVFSAAPVREVGSITHDRQNQSSDRSSYTSVGYKRPVESNIISNVTQFNKKEDKIVRFQRKPSLYGSAVPILYGDVDWISFYCTVLSRFAYMNDNKFVENYLKIFGPIIPIGIMNNMNDYLKNNEDIMSLNDKDMFDLENSGDKIEFENTLNQKTTLWTTKDKDENVHLEFIPLSKKINYILGEVNEKDSSFENEEKKECDEANNLYNTLKDNNSLKFVSISTSNYGEIYVMCDTRCPNMLFVLFRGTYSAKTAAAYTKPTSIMPQWVGNIINKNGSTDKEEYLYGIFKLLSDIIHTLFDAIIFIANTYLIPAIKDNSNITLITTGQSLGGGLTTIFSYVWAEHIKRKFAEATATATGSEDDNTTSTPAITPALDTSNPTVLATMRRINSNIVAISIASPRVMSKTLADYFCLKHLNQQGQQVELNDLTVALNKGDVFFKRLTNRGDPVPALPPAGSRTLQKMLGNLAKTGDLVYGHPCSDNQIIRKQISENCNAHSKQISRYVIPKYSDDLNCKNEKDRIIGIPTGNDILSIYKHIVYLDINYRYAIDTNLLEKGSAKSFVTTYEIKREYNSATNHKDTVCRLVFYDGSKVLTGGDSIEVINKDTKQKAIEAINKLTSKTYEERVFKVVFFNLEKLRVNTDNSVLNSDTPVSEKTMIAVGRKIRYPIEDKRMNYNLFLAMFNNPACGIIHKGSLTVEDIKSGSLKICSDLPNRGRLISSVLKPPTEWQNQDMYDVSSVISNDVKELKYTNYFTIMRKPPIIDLNISPSDVKFEGDNEEENTAPVKSVSLNDNKSGGSRRIRKRSKQNKTNRRKGRRQNKSKRRINVIKRISKRHNKTRK
jgi:hypothetical protein